MKKLVIILTIFFSVSCINTYSQASLPYELPNPVKLELKRLTEAYTILEQFSDSVWPGWNNYKEFPFLLTFQNGLRVLVGHPKPPSEFVPYNQIKVQNLALHIDTTNINNFQLKFPLTAGGGPIPFNNVTVVNIDYKAPLSYKDTPVTFKGEDNIMIFIHELMHCYQPKILKRQYGNLRINPDLNLALYAEIEGNALLKAYEQTSFESSLPYLKDFCVARNLKLKDLKPSEKSSAACDEFREGEAVYSEYIILQHLKKGYKSSLSSEEDTAYKHFGDTDAFFKKYSNYLKDAKGNTFDMYGKNYWYGCYEALLLQRYFPGWQKDVLNEMWLSQIISKNINLSAEDSIQTLQRFKDIYYIDSLKSKHDSILNGRNEIYKSLTERTGRTYVIDMKPIKQYVQGLVNNKYKKYDLGLIRMYPEGIGEIKFDSFNASFKPVPTEINQLYYIKVIDADANKHKKPYQIEYKSKDDKGYFYDVTINTPLFTLKAPKVSVRENENRVKFVIHSRS